MNLQTEWNQSVQNKQSVLSSSPPCPARDFCILSYPLLTGENRFSFSPSFQVFLMYIKFCTTPLIPRLTKSTSFKHFSHFMLADYFLLLLSWDFLHLLHLKIKQKSLNIKINGPISIIIWDRIVVILL